MHGQYDDLARGVHLHKFPGRREPVFIGHTDIQHDDLGLQRGDFFQSFKSLFRLPANLPLRPAAQDHPHTLPHNVMIVNDENTQGAVCFKIHGENRILLRRVDQTLFRVGQTELHLAFGRYSHRSGGMVRDNRKLDGALRHHTFPSKISDRGSFARLPDPNHNSPGRQSNSLPGILRGNYPRLRNRKGRLSNNLPELRFWNSFVAKKKASRRTYSLKKTPPSRIASITLSRPLAPSDLTTKPLAPLRLTAAAISAELCMVSTTDLTGALPRESSVATARPSL